MGLFRKKDVSDADRLALTDKQEKLLREQQDMEEALREQQDMQESLSDRLDELEAEKEREEKAKEKRGDTSPSGDTSSSGTDGVADAVEKLLARFPASKFAGSEIEGLMEGIKDLIATKDPKKIQKASDVPSSTPNLDSTSQLHMIIKLLEKIEKNTSKYGNLQEILEKIERLENIDRAYHRYD